MGVVGRGVDALGLYLSGGSANTDPDLSLGGVQSSTRVRGLGAEVLEAVPAFRVDHVFPACGEGVAVLTTDSSGNLTLTPPDGNTGPPVPTVPGGFVIVAGGNRSKAVLVYREPGLALAQSSGRRTTTLKLVRVLDGMLSQSDVADGQRSAGETTYRAVFLVPRGSVPVLGVRLWFPYAPGSQARFALGLDPAAGSTIQTIPDEMTPPIGVVWSSPTTRDGALFVPFLLPGTLRGVWVRRKFPVGGRVAPEEDAQLSIAYQGG